MQERRVRDTQNQVSRIAALLAGLVLLIGHVACVDPCGNDVLTEARSPDGRLKAVVFQRDCGATTGFSTQVSVIPSGESFLTAPTWLRSTRGGNVFVADTNHGEAPSGPVVQVEWLDPTHLRITHDKRARVFSSATSIHGVRVTLQSDALGRAPEMGTWRRSYRASASGELKVVPGKSDAEFELELWRGAPSYNSGFAAGRIFLKDGRWSWETKEFDGLCRLVFTFEPRLVRISQVGDSGTCGFGYGVMADGDYALISHEKPKFREKRGVSWRAPCAKAGPLTRLGPSPAPRQVSIHSRGALARRREQFTEERVEPERP